jgi:hypothetical protein
MIEITGSLDKSTPPLADLLSKGAGHLLQGNKWIGEYAHV